MNSQELEQAFNETTDNVVNLLKENVELKKKINKAIEKLEYYNSGEALYFVPIQDIIDILKIQKQL